MNWEGGKEGEAEGERALPSEQPDTRSGINAAKFRFRTLKSITFTTERLGARRRVGGPLDNLLIV